MSINCKCPKCSKSFKLADKLAGKQGKCPSCGNQFKIPVRRAASTQEMPRLPDNPFGGLDDDFAPSADGETYRPRRRGQRGIFSQMVGCLFLLVFLLVALVGGAYAALYFKLVKREITDPYLARVPFKIPGLTTGPKNGESTEPETTAKGPNDTAPKEGATETKKDDTPAVPLEFRYLPDKAALLVSINVEGLMASKVYPKVKPSFAGGNPDPDKAIDENMQSKWGVPMGSLSRIIFGARTKDEWVNVLRTKQPVAPDEIKKNRKADFTEVKVGKYVMYDSKEYPFCVVDNRTVLVGAGSDALKKILERDKPPEMVADLQPVFKQVTETKTISLAFGPQELQQQVPLITALKLPNEIKALADSQAFALQIDLTAGMEIAASLQCKNAADAESLKKAAGENMAKAYFEQLGKANAGKPPEQWARDAIQALSQLKLAVSGDTLNATLAVNDDIAANLILLLAISANPEPPKK